MYFHDTFRLWILIITRWHISVRSLLIKLYGSKIKYLMLHNSYSNIYRGNLRSRDVVLLVVCVPKWVRSSCSTCPTSWIAQRLPSVT